MTRALFDPRTGAALGALDPARDAVVDPGRYESTLARVLAVDPAQPTTGSEETPPRRRVRRRRIAVPAGVLAATAAATAVLVAGQPAYADWTPVPVALSAGEATEAARSCLAHQGEPGDTPADVLIADRRGPWIYVLVASAQQESSCVMPESLVGTTPSTTDRRMHAGGAGEVLTDPVGARRVDVAIWSASGTDEGLFMLIEGRVGSEVAGVEVLTPTGKRVTASVHDGRFAAWWPAGRSSTRTPELTGAPSLQVTMTDGTVVTVPG